MVQYFCSILNIVQLFHFIEPFTLCLSGSLIHTVRNTDALTHVIRAIYRSYCAITWVTMADETRISGWWPRPICRNENKIPNLHPWSSTFSKYIHTRFRKIILNFTLNIHIDNFIFRKLSLGCILRT